MTKEESTLLDTLAEAMKRKLFGSTNHADIADYAAVNKATEAVRSARIDRYFNDAAKAGDAAAFAYVHNGYK